MGIRTAVNVLWSDAIVLVFEGMFHGGRSNIGPGRKLIEIGNYASNGPGHRSTKLRLPSGDATGLSWERVFQSCSHMFTHIRSCSLASSRKQNEAAPYRLLDTGDAASKQASRVSRVSLRTCYPS